MPVHLLESQEKSRNLDRWAASKAERLAFESALTERFDWIEEQGLTRWIIAEQNPHRSREEENCGSQTAA
jgi:hypothetical protein